MDFNDRIVNWYIGIFKWFAFIGFALSILLTFSGIIQLLDEPSPQSVLMALAMPLWILTVGNFALMISMYQVLESIDSKRL